MLKRLLRPQLTTYKPMTGLLRPCLPKGNHVRPCLTKGNHVFSFRPCLTEGNKKDESQKLLGFRPLYFGTPPQKKSVYTLSGGP